MKSTFRTVGCYAIKALNRIAFLAFVGFAAVMITTHGDKAYNIGHFLAPYARLAVFPSEMRVTVVPILGV